MLIAGDGLYDEKVDVYSFAMMFYNLLSCLPPWPTTVGTTVAFMTSRVGSSATISFQGVLASRSNHETVLCQDLGYADIVSTCCAWEQEQEQKWLLGSRSASQRIIANIVSFLEQEEFEQ